MTGQSEMHSNGDQISPKGAPIPEGGAAAAHQKPCVASKRAYALAAYKNKVKDGKRAVVRLKLQKNGQLNAITSQLLLLEARLRQEQKEILNQLGHKDAVITSQKQEIEKLRRENKRLIGRLKRLSESRTEDQKTTPTKSRSDCDVRVKTPKSSSKLTSKTNLSKTCSTNPEILSLTSQFYDVHCSSSVTSAGEEKVFHKPPIAEKPKLASTRMLLRAKLMEEKDQNDNSQCNIVSTISRLLEEESDQGIAISSGSSDEPSSPESTLKPTTPRVIKIARQFEKGFSKVTSQLNQEWKKSRANKSLVMDEYEVTSGYNSETVSEQDHDYENILISSHPQIIEGNTVYGTPSPRLRNDASLTDGSGYDGDSTLVEEDAHTYSNVEYSGGEIVNEEEVSEESDKYWGAPSSIPSYSISPEDVLLETNLDLSDTGSESTLSDSPRSAKNVPRSRDNINNLLMSSEDGSHIMQNFIEFSLDSLDLEDLDDDLGKENLLPLCEARRCGDGAEAEINKEARTEASLSEAQHWLTTTQGGFLIPSQCGYEKFLEVTGLSQKSILTPSRMFSNHRSVLKPRDIKHRDKLRAVFTTAMCIPEESSTPITTVSSNSHCDIPSSATQRYYREPYL